VDAGAPRLRKAYRNRLFRGPCPVLALADVVDLLADERACLCRRRAPGSFGLACAFHRRLLSHSILLKALLKQHEYPQSCKELSRCHQRWRALHDAHTAQGPLKRPPLQIRKMQLVRPAQAMGESDVSPIGRFVS
jgi:hypothetical protein